MELAYQLKIDKQKREEEIIELDNAVKNLNKKVKELKTEKVGRHMTFQLLYVASYV